MHRLLFSFLIIFISSIGFAQVVFFEYYGNFHQMMKSGNTDGAVNLSALPKSTGYWGLGALAGLRGEIIQVDGNLLVSRGSNLEGLVTNPTDLDQAVLWAGAKVERWKPILVSYDMTQSEFEKFVMTEASQLSLNLNHPFAFRVTGDYAHIIWHVLTGDSPNPAVHPSHGNTKSMGHGHPAGGHANKQSGMHIFRNPTASGQLVAIYSGAQLEGVVSHPGERFHVHYIDNAQRLSGHVDQYSVRKGSTLWMPRP